MGFYHQVIDGFAKTRLGGWTLVTIFNPIDKFLMLRTNGKINTGFGTEFRDNGVLLICTGAKSGQTRHVPLLTTPMDENFVLIASNAGRNCNPAWYHNLRANPDCQLLVPERGQLACVAIEAEGRAREAAWRAANTQFTGYKSYQSRTDRHIPVMILTPVVSD